MSSFPLPIERLLPQRPPMLLLDRLLSCTPGEGTADVLISPGNLFRLPDYEHINEGRHWLWVEGAVPARKNDGPVRQGRGCCCQCQG